MSVNDSQQVVGNFWSPSSLGQAFLWQNGVVAYLDGLDANKPSYAMSINNNGVIVGSSVPKNKNRQHATEWLNGSVINLHPDNDIYDREGLATSINSQGSITGYENDNSFISYSNEGKRWIYDFQSHSINNSEKIVGSTSNHRAAYWTVSSGLQIIGPPSSVATSINDLDEIAGSTFLDQSWIWQNGIFQNLGIFSWTKYIIANHINNKSQIVGEIRSSDNTGTIGGFLWQGGVLSDLNSLISPDQNWYVLTAFDINDNGDIVGYGIHNGQQTGFLMTPVPEPSSLLALYGGVAGLLAFRRRR